MVATRRWLIQDVKLRTDEARGEEARSRRQRTVQEVTATVQHTFRYRSCRPISSAFQRLAKVYDFRIQGSAREPAGPCKATFGQTFVRSGSPGVATHLAALAAAGCRLEVWSMLLHSANYMGVGNVQTYPVHTSSLPSADLSILESLQHVNQ